MNHRIVGVGNIKGTFPPVVASRKDSTNLTRRDPALVRAERCSFEPTKQEKENNEGDIKVLPLLSRTAPLEVRSRTKRIAVAPAPKNVYRYKHVPGNNGRVILYNFRKRPWWHSGNEKNKGTTKDAKEEVVKGGKDRSSKDNTSDDIKDKREIINFDLVILHHSFTLK